MINPMNYFDLYDVFVNEVFGSYWLFFIVTCLVLVIVLTHFKLSYGVVSGVLLLFALVSYSGSPTFAYTLFVISVLVVGVSVYSAISEELSKLR